MLGSGGCGAVRGRLPCRALLACVLVAVLASPSFGNLAELEADCADAKLKVSSYSIKQLSRCYSKLYGKTGQLSRIQACESKVAFKLLDRIARANSRQKTPGFTCQGDAESLALVGDEAWQQTLTSDAVVSGNALPDRCVGKRARVIGKYATKYAKCRGRYFSGPGAEMSACVARSIPVFDREWALAGAKVDCNSDEPGAVRAAIEAAVEAQADSLRIECGDGLVGGFEECDGGGLGQEGGCEADCSAPLVCGNGFVQVLNNEECDDGNLTPGDGCDENCVLEVCGNGIVQDAAGEECDDAGESVACDADCSLPLCGDGFRNEAFGEECDDVIASEFCDADCTLALCGDGTLNPAAGEACDEPVETPDCDSDCTAVVCGDGLLNASAGEICDPGEETVDCDLDCTPSACGDLEVNVTAGEECEDGNEEFGDGCTPDCLAEECGEVQGETVCLYCPQGRVADATYTVCLCEPGYQDVGGVCEDLDECALELDECPEGAVCQNVVGTYSCAIGCTEAQFQQALDSCGAPSGVITFNCQDAVIPIVHTTNSPERTVDCDGLVIDGLDNNVTFELAPACFDVPIDPEDCVGTQAPDGSCDCPNVNGMPHFLNLAGDDMVLRNIGLRYFFDGVLVTGNNVTVESVTFDRVCDDAFANGTTAVGTVFRSLTASNGCDKCSQNDGDLDLLSDDPLAREYYSARFEDVDFIDCGQPLRMTSGGRFRIDRARILGTQPSGLFACQGPRFTTAIVGALAVHIRDSEVDGCSRGIRVGQDAEVSIARTSITNSKQVALRVSGDAHVRLWDSVIADNGGTTSSEEGLGGVAILDKGKVDLGGGGAIVDGSSLPSPGRNVICNNVGPGDVPHNVDNVTNRRLVKAENNYWCTEDPDDTLSGNGNTDVHPFLSEAP